MIVYLLAWDHVLQTSEKAIAHAVPTGTPINVHRLVHHLSLQRIQIHMSAGLQV